MTAGLFGKLPAKRDFIAANAPRRFLEVWEPWLQASVATSRQMLGAGWGETYNRAPIWRFWLGADFCGEAMIGAFMASIDGVGRSFPLTDFRRRRRRVAAAARTRLQRRLVRGGRGDSARRAGRRTPTFEAVAAAVAALAPPSLQPRASEISGLQELPEAAVLVRDVDDKIDDRLSRRPSFRPPPHLRDPELLVDDRRRGLSSRSPSPASAFPLATRFADMLTGAFAAPSTEDA